MKFDINSSYGYAISTTLNILRKNFNAKIDKFNLTSEQYGVLKLIDELGGLTPTKIASMLERDKATITRIINSLEKKGYIIKESINNKSFEIKMTKEGKKNYEMANVVAEEFHAKLRGLMQEGEYECLMNALRKIKDSFKEEE
ncbi:MAG: MarR family transcriptional regulator [Epsilonproteobacteria bacterium]|nr:MarR family transcriptional regulator [Campylobacterota bacterium]